MSSLGWSLGALAAPRSSATLASPARRWHMSLLGRLGVWTFFDGMPAPEAAAVAKRIEAWGYTALWLPEAVGRDPFAFIAYLGEHTRSLVFATGIANIYARDPMAMNALRLTVGESTGGRFALGIGVSHGHLVTA